MDDHAVIGRVRCEGCGYELDGLDPDGVCSECGLAVAMSLPRDRAGTPWQQRAGFGSLVRTWWLLMTDDACWREMRIGLKGRRRFVGWVRALVYGVLFVAAAGFVLVETGGRLHAGALTYLVLAMVAMMVAVEIVQRLYGGVIGLRLWVRSNTQDEGREGAAHQQVRDHASVGMLIAPLFLAAGVVCVTLGIVLEGATGSMALLRVMFWIAGVIGALGMVVGVVLFELAYRRGWRVMRFRRLVSDEREQEHHDDFDDGLSNHPVDDLLNLAALLTTKHRDPMRSISFGAGMALKYVLTPVMFFVLWKGYGMHVGAALILALAGFCVCAVLMRVVLLILGVIWGREPSR